MNNSKAFNHGSPQGPGDYVGYGQNSPMQPGPGGIPKEVLQAAAMSGGGSGRRNIKIRAVNMKSEPITSNHDVVNN